MIKRFMITLLLIIIPNITFAMPPVDKTAHFGVGYVVNDQLQKHTKMTFLERLGCVVVIAGAKELSDFHWDNHDFLATVAGCMFVEIKF